MQLLSAHVLEFMDLCFNVYVSLYMSVYIFVSVWIICVSTCCFSPCILCVMCANVLIFYASGHFLHICIFPCVYVCFWVSICICASTFLCSICGFVGLYICMFSSRTLWISSLYHCFPPAQPSLYAHMHITVSTNVCSLMNYSNLPFQPFSKKVGYKGGSRHRVTVTSGYWASKDVGCFLCCSSTISVLLPQA